ATTMRIVAYYEFLCIFDAATEHVLPAMELNPLMRHLNHNGYGAFIPAACNAMQATNAHCPHALIPCSLLCCGPALAHAAF
ncbi:MAG: hypothetical protein ABF436_08755, partial [Acetobacter okinawensis]|uniref:hypothetical protein n=1 Tax=Acetobacter okinawensis TaxID=1076594 RepID=UPI0039EAAF86